MAPTGVDDSSDEGGSGSTRGWVDNFWSRAEKLALDQRARRVLPRPLRNALLSVANLRGWQALDDQINRDGRMPDDEELAVETIWVCECYPPSRIGGLVSGLEALNIRGRMSPSGSIADTVRRYRSGAYAGGTVNLGSFTRRGEPIFGLDYVETDLPASVRRASGWLENITPSLTAVTIQFELTNEAGAAVQRALRANYRTRLRLRRRSFKILDPDNQRREAMDEAIGGLNRECAAWMRQHLPGAFADGLLGGDYPTCAFIETKTYVPLLETEEYQKWQWVARLDAGDEVWDAEDRPGLRLRTPHRDEERHHWWLAGRKDVLARNPRDVWLGYEMDMMLMLHGTDSLMMGMHDAVSRSRDSMGAGASRQWNLRRLDALRGDVTSFVRDVEPVASELISRHWQVFDRATFRPGPDHILSRIRDSETRPAAGTVPTPLDEPVKPRGRRPKASSSPAPPVETARLEPLPTLASDLADNIRDRAQRLLEAERQHRDALATVSMLVAASESFRLERRVFLLTVLLLVIAVIAALPQIVDLAMAILQQFGAVPSPSGSASPSAALSGFFGLLRLVGG